MRQKLKPLEHNKMTHTSHNENHLMNAPVDDAFGFFGTIATNEEVNPDEAAKAFADAMHNLMEGPWQANATLARNFLRSRWGRHFADRACCYTGLTLADRIQQAAGEDWIGESLYALKVEGFHKRLFDDEA
jgi:hypothetical protein